MKIKILIGLVLLVILVNGCVSEESSIGTPQFTKGSGYAKQLLLTKNEVESLGFDVDEEGSAVSLVTENVESEANGYFYFVDGVEDVSDLSNSIKIFKDLEGANSYYEGELYEIKTVIPFREKTERRIISSDIGSKSYAVRDIVYTDESKRTIDFLVFNLIFIKGKTFVDIYLVSRGDNYSNELLELGRIVESKT